MEPKGLLFEAREMWKNVGELSVKFRKYSPPSITCYACEQKPEEERFNCPYCKEIEKAEKRRNEVLQQFSEEYIVPVAVSEGYKVLKGVEGYGLKDSLVKGKSFKERKELDVVVDIVGTVEPKKIVPKVIVKPFAHYREIKVDSHQLQWLLDISSPKESLVRSIKEFENNIFPNVILDKLEDSACHLDKSLIPVDLLIV